MSDCGHPNCGKPGLTCGCGSPAIRNPGPANLRRCVSCGGWITSFHETVNDGWQHTNCPMGHPSCRVCKQELPPVRYFPERRHTCEACRKLFTHPTRPATFERELTIGEAAVRRFVNHFTPARYWTLGDDQQTWLKKEIDTIAQEAQKRYDVLLEERDKYEKLVDLTTSYLDWMMPRRRQERKFLDDVSTALRSLRPLEQTGPGPFDVRLASPENRCDQQARIAGGLTQCILPAPHDDKPCIFNVAMALPVVQQ
jgi:hypothetical protein